MIVLELLRGGAFREHLVVSSLVHSGADIGNSKTKPSLHDGWGGAFCGKRTLVNLRFEALRMRQTRLVPLSQRVSTPLGEPSALLRGGQHVPLPDVLLEQQEHSGIPLGALLVGFRPDGLLAVAVPAAVTYLLLGVLL